MRGRSVLLTVMAGLVLALPVAAQAGRPFTTEDALDVRTVRIADVTDDARWVAATVSTRRDRSGVDHFRYGDPTYIAPSVGELLVVDAQGGTVRSLFDGREQLRSPVWSPDGSRLAFFRLQGDAFRLMVHEPASGRTREVSLRTDKAVAANSPLVWTPDGSAVLVALRPDGWATEARSAFLQLSEGPVVVQDSRDDFLDWDRVRNLDRLQLPALVTLANGAVRELPGPQSLEDPRFAPDGSYLTYAKAEPKRTSYKRADGTEYSVVRLPLGGGEPETLMGPQDRRITAQWNEAATGFGWAERGDVFVRFLDADSARNLTQAHRGPVSDTDTTKISYSLERWRPDGSALLLSSQKGYHLLDARSGELQMVFEFQGEEKTRPRLTPQGWSEDGRYVYLGTSARDRWERGLVRLDVASHRLEDLVKDANLYGDWSLSEDGSRVVFRRSDGDRPDELFTADSRFTDVRRLTELNPQLEGVALSRSELVEYLDVDGSRLYGVLNYPHGYEPGRKYPLVAEIYETFFDNGYNENMNLVTARGWFGFRPSVDLEIGYPGEAWLKGVTPALNVLIERGLVDEKQVGVYGQSYGGYAVNLLVTQTDRFAAAVNVSGKVNIISFLGDSEKITTRNYNAAEEGQDRIGATLWEQPQKYVAHSAVMFADRIETPLLLLSGEGDWNVPATNQREMYYALRRLGKEVVWVNYMKGGHGAGRASNVEDFHDHWRRLLDWMGEHFVKAAAERAVSQ
ncbi:MAG: prolyl oligopeptidase family serine peptidase [Longimicrobiales bacterium]|nr:prolyl oligopeptidase family serine peptidase [Longimicrobiales bacterium]